MAGTKAGAEKARDTNLRKHGPDFYVKLGAIGGKIGRTGGFYHMAINDPERLAEIGRRGGKASGREKKQ